MPLAAKLYISREISGRGDAYRADSAEQSSCLPSLMSNRNLVF